jgi:fumarate reductase subunit D
MRRFRSLVARFTTMVLPVLLLLIVPSLALGQIQEEPLPGEEERSYAMQWGMVVLLNLVAFLLLCKPAFREDKVQKEKKRKGDKKKGGH